jgi:hypothetical protein
MIKGMRTSMTYEEFIDSAQYDEIVQRIQKFHKCIEYCLREAESLCPTDACHAWVNTHGGLYRVFVPNFSDD